MTHVSRPLIGLLVATVVFFALWTVALKPHGSSGGAGGSSGQGLGQYQADINAAHRAVQTADAAGAPARKATAISMPHAAPKLLARPAQNRKPAATRAALVQRALRSHRVLALLFYNPRAPDDRAIHQELTGVPTRRGRVFKLAIPLEEIGRYTSITEALPVNLSPTLVLVAPDRQTDEIVGYADAFEISQRIDDALALR